MQTSPRTGQARPEPPSNSALRRAFGSVVGILLATACGAGAGATPESTVAALAEALDDGRYDDAYALMSERFRRRVPLREFRAHLESNRHEARATAKALADRVGPAEQTATVAYADGEELEMVHEPGGWKVAANVTAFYDQSTPRAALRSFVRAMERRRYDVILRMVPSAEQDGVSVENMKEAWTGEGREEVERLVSHLREHLDSPIEEVGDRASMPYGESSVARLVREDGRWKIEDPD